jgi:hypothetical protein
MLAKANVKGGVQDHAYYFSEQFVRPNGHTKRALFVASFLWDGGSLGRFPLMTITQICGDLKDDYLTDCAKACS